VGLYTIGSASAAISGASLSIQGFLMLNVLSIPNEPDPQTMRELTTLWALVYAAVGLMAHLFGSVEGAAFGAAAEHLTSRLRSTALRALLQQEIGYFDDGAHTVGALTTFLSEKIHPNLSPTPSDHTPTRRWTVPSHSMRMRPRRRQVTHVQALLAERLQAFIRFTFTVLTGIVFMFAFGDWRTVCEFAARENSRGHAAVNPRTCP
jgi:ABC-type multidrug transport system fused ATPase/permease subunit